MSDVPLLNPVGADGKASTQMLDALKAQLHDAETRLLTQRAQSYDAYIGMYDAVSALRRALTTAKEVYGRNFKI